jgi:hypothetical protein
MGALATSRCAALAGLLALLPSTARAANDVTISLQQPGRFDLICKGPKFSERLRFDLYTGQFCDDLDCIPRRLTKWNGETIEYHYNVDVPSPDHQAHTYREERDPYISGTYKDDFVINKSNLTYNRKIHGWFGEIAARESRSEKSGACRITPFSGFRQTNNQVNR